jgi:hypothetical protein
LNFYLVEKLRGLKEEPPSKESPPLDAGGKAS